MKFATGYILGALTIAAIGASYAGGVLSHAYFMEKKSDVIKKADEATIADMMRSYIDSKRN